MFGTSLLGPPCTSLVSLKWYLVKAGECKSPRDIPQIPFVKRKEPLLPFAFIGYPWVPHETPVRKRNNERKDLWPPVGHRAFGTYSSILCRSSFTPHVPKDRVSITLPHDQISFYQHESKSLSKCGPSKATF